MTDGKTRITFSCPNNLRDKLTKRADKEGIPRSQLIVELLEAELDSPTEGKGRDAAVNRLIFDIQKRVGDLESWKREFSKMSKDQQINTENLESSLAYLLNEDAARGGSDVGKTMTTKKGSIPEPKK
ncbi:MAG: ribbon-helix-helix protein, CopG family [Candidatus Heimdallarchaeota archaeon]|nr:ribbon-helix-helix protein, CopG family [Candidatus Heimdallarchaeota archaeon]